jgi:hypothetical protein
MYAYIYDEFTNQNKFGKALYKIEKRLTDLNLNGKIIRLGVSKNIKVAVEDEIRQGTKTIVAVGNDKTVSQIINAIANDQSDEKHQVTLGIIPISEKDSQIAATFGIKTISSACEILLARRLETFQLAKINQNFFLFNLILASSDTILEIDKKNLLQNPGPSVVEITNSPNWPKEKSEEKKLKLKISNKAGESLFSVKELFVANKTSVIIADNSLTLKTPTRISLGEEKIKIIVGKERSVPQNF